MQSPRALKQRSDSRASTEIALGFSVPGGAQTCAPAIPLLSLAATIGTDGTLAGAQTLYYGISAVDAAGRESELSFVVRTSIPDGESTHNITLGGLSFGRGTTSFNVYRGANPSQLFRIATDQAPASTFCDNGLAKQISWPA